MTNRDDAVPAGMPAGPAEVAYWTSHEERVAAMIEHQLRAALNIEAGWTFRMRRRPAVPERPAACYLAPAGFRVHVRPGCRCPKP